MIVRLSNKSDFIFVWKLDIVLAETEKFDSW